MNNFNKEQILHCKYCNKICHSINSLKQHEIRCKENPNKIQCKGFCDINKRTINPNNHTTKGKIMINNGIKSKYINKDELNVFIENGWILGMCDKTKELIKLHDTGIASTPEKELLRKEKISKSMKKNPNAGGYRENSGRGKKGKYKNIYCDSSWELAFVVYHIDNNLNIKRCTEHRKYIFNNEEHIYIPDFITDGGIIEIKGYKSKQWNEKHKQNPDIKVLYYEDMKRYLDYVENKYGSNWIELLYNK